MSLREEASIKSRESDAYLRVCVFALVSESGNKRSFSRFHGLLHHRCLARFTVQVLVLVLLMCDSGMRVGDELAWA